MTYRGCSGNLWQTDVGCKSHTFPVGSGLGKDGLSHPLYSVFISKEFLCIAKRHNPAIGDDMVQLASFNPQLRLRKVWKWSLSDEKGPTAHSSDTEDLLPPTEVRQHIGERMEAEMDKNRLVQLPHWCTCGTGVLWQRERERESWTRRHSPPFISWSMTFIFSLSGGYWLKNESGQEAYHVSSSPAPK